jgi:hypothetical protein
MLGNTRQNAGRAASRIKSATHSANDKIHSYPHPELDPKIAGNDGESRCARQV